jgi:hypothetical protein
MPYPKKSLETLIPILYLGGVSTGDIEGRMGDGTRESAHDRRALLLDLKRRGLAARLSPTERSALGKRLARYGRRRVWRDNQGVPGLL